MVAEVAAQIALNVPAQGNQALKVRYCCSLRAGCLGYCRGLGKDVSGGWSQLRVVAQIVLNVPAQGLALKVRTQCSTRSCRLHSMLKRLQLTSSSLHSQPCSWLWVTRILSST